MRLDVLLQDVDIQAVTGGVNIDISGIAYDSRRVTAGSLFVAMKGEVTDGNRYVDAALQAGATAVVSELPAPEQVNAAWIQVRDARRVMAVLAKRFYDSPDEKLLVAGITGTNGKTSVAHLLQGIFRYCLGPTGMLGTIAYSDGLEQVQASLTTPESPDIFRFLRHMVDAGSKAAVMEASSVALHRSRVAEIDFDLVLFTNLTRDHLDYHGDMETYYQAKRMLFDRWDEYDPFAVINIDDASGQRLYEETTLRKLSFGLSPLADVRTIHADLDHRSSRLVIQAPSGKFDVQSPLLGRFNAENILAAVAGGIACGFDTDLIAEAVKTVPVVRGRMEPVPGDQPFTVMVDYAHTDDALLRLLKAAREITAGRIIVVFGCGGDRDPGKRPLMGQHAVLHADLAILTSDNPRTEDPMAIIADVEAGIAQVRGTAEYLCIPDRREAIFKAVSLAREGDVVLLAGKGHEDYQIIGTTKRHFDDREVAMEAMAAL